MAQHLQGMPDLPKGCRLVEDRGNIRFVWGFAHSVSMAPFSLHQPPGYGLGGMANQGGPPPLAKDGMWPRLHSPEFEAWAWTEGLDTVVFIHTQNCPLKRLSIRGSKLFRFLVFLVLCNSFD